MKEPKEREKPKNWASFRQSLKLKWLLPLLFVEWVTGWAAYLLSRSSILEFLEYCGSFSILIAVIFYFIDAPQRTKDSHYQAWQVINSAQGKGGSGGRGDALQDLNEDHVPLVGVDLSDAFLQGVKLEKADLRRSKFHSADLKGADLSKSNLEQSALVFANLRSSNLAGVNLTDVDLTDADLGNARLAGCDFQGADLTRADLRGADLSNAMDWKSIVGIRLANLHGMKNAPEGFTAWAMGKGAVDVESDRDWEKIVSAQTPR